MGVEMLTYRGCDTSVKEKWFIEILRNHLFSFNLNEKSTLMWCLLAAKISGNFQKLIYQNSFFNKNFFWNMVIAGIGKSRLPVSICTFE